MEHKKLCVVGGGPSGLSLLYQLKKLQREGHVIPQIVCYERTNDILGQWNFTDKIGFEKSGEPVHSAMYNELWINTPKEVAELEDYSFETHFGTNTRSFITREKMAEYLRARFFRQGDLNEWLRLNTRVSDVKYTNEGKFRVWTEKEGREEQEEEEFDWVVVATGMYSRI